MSAPVLAVTTGCPAGVGPEVAIRAAARAGDLRCVLVGDAQVIRAAAKRRRVAQRRLIVLRDAAQIRGLQRGQIGLWGPSVQLAHAAIPGEPTREAGAAQLGWIDQATKLVQQRSCAALVTGPVSKAVIARSGAPGARQFRGHTEHLAAQLRAREVVMAFHSAKLTTALVTTHLPLRQVARAITAPRVAMACDWLVRLLWWLGVARPRVWVASLNPHAGEDGLLGREEQRALAPGMVQARRRLVRAGRPAELIGPIGAETAFRTAVAGGCDGVVAMYHDQATIAGKVSGFGEMVNVTLGLPIVRTSVDHGTAYDIAGTGQASDRSMRAALALAARLTKAVSNEGYAKASSDGRGR